MKNRELCAANDDLSIIAFITIQRLKWLGHVLRMEGSRTVKSCTRVLLVESDLKDGLEVGGEITVS